MSLEISYIWKHRRPYNVAGLASCNMTGNAGCKFRKFRTPAKLADGYLWPVSLLELGNRCSMMLTSGKYGLNGSWY